MRVYLCSAFDVPGSCQLEHSNGGDVMDLLGVTADERWLVLVRHFGKL